MSFSRSKLPKEVFIAGIGTDVGKTMVSALMCLGLDLNYWKPVQAGLDPHTDTQWVQEATQLPLDYFLPEAFCLKTPASPHVAASLEGLLIEESALHPPKSKRSLLIEGAGGLMVPLNSDYLYIDWLCQHQIPTVLVVKTYLGCINHSLLSIDALRNRKIPLLGIVFNDGGRPESEDVIAAHAKAPVLGRLPHIKAPTAKTLQAAFDTYFNFPFQ